MNSLVHRSQGFLLLLFVQIQVQIAQLGAQQDAIQQHCDTVELLMAQKESLQKSLADTTMRVEALQAQEVRLLDRVHTLEQEALESADYAYEMCRASEDAEVRCEEANRKMRKLLQVTTEYRAHIERLGFGLELEQTTDPGSHPNLNSDPSR
jgi:septal ring factor EnvC (AmiA/AmiB activator)